MEKKRNPPVISSESLEVMEEMKNIGAKWSLSIERGLSLFVFHAFVDVYVLCLPMCIPYCEQRSSIIYITHAHYHAAIHKKNPQLKIKMTRELIKLRLH